MRIHRSTRGYMEVQLDTWEYRGIHRRAGGSREHRKIYRGTGGIYVSKGGYMEVDGDT